MIRRRREIITSHLWDTSDIQNENSRDEAQELYIKNMNLNCIYTPDDRTWMQAIEKINGSLGKEDLRDFGANFSRPWAPQGPQKWAQGP